jgi:RNA polymerase sigma-70 factor (sigma-E family)
MRITKRRGQVRDDFERFVAGSVDDLLRTAYLVTWDLAAAQDLVQECLFRLARRWPRVRSMGYPAAYARQVVVNLALDGARRRGRHRSELGGSGWAPVEDRLDSSAELALGTVEARSELVEGLKALAPRQRAVLVLRYLNDLPEAQVAKILGCSVGTVKNTAFHALERLRQDLARQETIERERNLRNVRPTRG